jgi:hypothetical protein
MRALTWEEFNAVRDIIREKRAVIDLVLNRLAAVHECITQRAEAGELETAVRPIAGGPTRPLESWMWNGRVEPRFYWCQMSLQKPFGAAIEGDGFSYIFVSRPALDRLLRRLKSEDEPQEEQPSAPPIPLPSATRAPRCEAGSEVSDMEEPAPAFAESAAPVEPSAGSMGAPKQNLTAGPGKQRRKAAGGARPQYAWARIEKKAFELLDHYGGISPDEPELSSQEALVTMLLQFCTSEFGREPVPSTMRKYASKWIVEYDGGKRSV